MLKNKSKLIKTVAVLVAPFFISMFILSRGAYADIEVDYGTGTSGGTGGGCSGVNSNDGRRDCCMTGGKFGGDCPHWIVGSIDEFKAAAEGTQYESEALSSKCIEFAERQEDKKEDPVVVWVGREIPGGSIMDNYAYSGNYRKTTRMDSFDESHQHIKSWDDPMPGTNGQSYGYIHKLVQDKLSDPSNDDDLVFFCPGMVDDGSDNGKVISKSEVKVSADGKEASNDTGFKVNATKDATIEVDVNDKSVKVNVAFTQYLKANQAPAATKYHVKYKVEKATGVKQRPGGDQDKTVKFDNTEPIIAYGGSYTGAGFTIPKGASGTYRVCEKIIYTPNSNGSKVIEGNEQYTEACAIVQAKNESTEDISCATLRGYVDSAHKPYYRTDHSHPSDDDPESYDFYKEAETGAISVVTGGKVESPLVGGFGRLSYAKPDDNVRFVHCYYPDVYKATTEPGGAIIAKQKDNYCIIDSAATNGGDYLFPKVESYAEGGGGGTCNKSNGKVGNTSTSAIISFAPKRSSTAYGKKGHYRIQGDPVEDLGTQFRQFVTYNDIYVYYTWTDRAEEYEECEGEGEDEECETRWHHPHVNGKIESYDVSEENSKPARVAVPYNFDTEIETNAYGNPSITYPGSEFRVEVSGSVESAKNNNRGKTYTTATPENSRVEVAQFILSPDASFTSAFEGNDNYNGNPAAYAGSLGGMQIISDTLESGSLEPGGFGAWERSSVVPDVETGSKICTVAGVYPTDSHGTPGQSKSGGYKKDDPGMEGFLKNGGAGWRISGVTCRTIVKKPSFQAWSGGIYSGTGIETSVTDKCLNSTLQWSSDSNCSKRIFGSWSEYEAISGYGSIRGLGSGAGFGYTWGVDTYGNGGRPGGYDSTAFNNSYYNVSHLSIANNNASGSGSSSSTGYSNISLNGEVLQRILSRYSSTTAGYNGCSFGYIDEGQVLAQSNRLVVLRCDGNVNINSDIIIGDRTYTKIDQLPQVVIIANNINISSNVTRLDAWLIATSRDAESTGSADGNINTCSDFVPSQTPSDGACSSKLVVNGPVIAGKVYLNRTYGALPGDGSIEPAEVFNLRADTYLWAYSQSEDYHQVITTYSRELAPRY